MSGITRVHGYAVSESFYGFQPRWFKIAGTGFDTNSAAVDSNFEKAVRAIESVATIVQLGVVGTGGFIVAVDGNTYNGRGSDSASDTLDSVVTAATSISTTVTEVYVGGGTGLVFTNS